jgi:DNA ligase D-like protein (predicted 3'-phosphoesterase)
MKKVKFVIHSHKAQRAGYHQDLRFQDPNNTSNWHSFAVPKEVPLTPNKRVLAIKTHIHTRDQAMFKGDIPAGEYGGGNIELYDQGVCGIQKFTSAHMTLILQGKIVNGMYHLISLGNVDTNKFKQQEYLLFKSKITITDPLRISMPEQSFYQKQIAKFNKFIKSF